MPVYKKHGTYYIGYANQPGRRRPIVDKEDYAFEIKKQRGISMTEALDIVESEFRAAEEEAAATGADGSDELSLNDRARIIVNEINPFKHFKRVVFKSRKVLIIYENQNEKEVLGEVKDFTGQNVYEFMLGKDCEAENIKLLIDRLAPLLFPKFPLLAEPEKIFALAMKAQNLQTDLVKETVEVEDLHPTTVSGCPVPSLKTIPYHYQSVNISNLNSYLKEFLERVDNHKHLCAIIWAQLSGIQWPYICYLYGKEGREGKSQFINMLGELSTSFATFNEDSRFATFPLYGKSFIFVPENDRSRLVSTKLIKSITGNSSVKIEQKNKNPFDGWVLGTIMVDANVPLKIGGRSFETDRLRYFTVKSHGLKQDMRLSPERYRRELSSTPNEFLNYCRACYEELVMPGGMLREPENHQALMESLSDIEQEFIYEKAFQKVCKDLKLECREGLMFPKAEFLFMTKKALDNKKEYYGESYVLFLEKVKGIVVGANKLINIGYVPVDTTHFVKPSAEDVGT